MFLQNIKKQGVIQPPNSLTNQISKTHCVTCLDELEEK